MRMGKDVLEIDMGWEMDFWVRGTEWIIEKKYSK